MLELLLCSLLTVFPDYLYRRYVQGKRLGKEITFYSVWYELRWGITACLMLTVGLITVVFYYHPSTKTATFLFRTVPIVPETIGRVAEINVSMSDNVAQGQQLFRLDDSKQRAAVETARRKIAEVEAGLMVARADVQAAEGKIQEARSAHQQALDELETKQELFRRNPGIVPRRDIEKLEVAVEGRQATITAAIAVPITIAVSVPVAVPIAVTTKSIAIVVAAVTIVIATITSEIAAISIVVAPVAIAVASVQEVIEVSIAVSTAVATTTVAITTISICADAAIAFAIAGRSAEERLLRT